MDIRVGQKVYVNNGHEEKEDHCGMGKGVLCNDYDLSCQGRCSRHQPGNVQVIDSVCAKKALECVEELIKLKSNKSILDAPEGGDTGWGWVSGYNDCIDDHIKPILKKYGFLP